MRSRPVASVSTRQNVPVRCDASMSGTLVAVTYSAEPSNAQFVACSPRRISSSTWPSGETTVTPPETVVATKSRPSAAKAMPSGTWSSESWQNVTGSPSSRRQMRCAIDSVQYSRCRASKAIPFGYTSGRSSSISPAPDASTAKSRPGERTSNRKSCSDPDSVK